MNLKCRRQNSLPRYGSPPESKEHRLRAVATVSDLRRALKFANERRSQGEASERLLSTSKDANGTLSRPNACEHTEQALTQAVVVPVKLHVAVQRIRKRKKPQKKLVGPNTSRVGRLMPSIQECLNKFWSDEVNSEDLLRLRVVFRSMSEDGLHVLCSSLPELMMRSGFHTLSEEKCRGLVQQITTFDYMDFEDFSDFSERAILEERKGYQELLKTWDPNPFDNFVEPAEQVRGFLNMLNVICTRKSILEILDFAGLKDELCNSPQEMLRFLAAYQSCEGFTKKEVSVLRSAFKSCEERTHVGPEGRLITPKSLNGGLLRFGGIYFLETWREMKYRQKINQTGVSFYEFLVHARRVRETQLQVVAQAVEQICSADVRQGLIEELRMLCRPLGFTLQEMEVTEILQEQGLSEPFCLDLAWDFVCHLRSRHGFTKAEKAELLESFHRFSQGTGELSTLKILELMGWLGLGGCIEKAHEMLRRVDFDNNGVLGENEFLRLMRMQKERNLEAYTLAYCKLRLGDAVTRSRLVAALAECEIFTENQLLEVITLRHGIKTAVTFGSFDRGAAGADIAASQGPSGLRAARTARTKLPGIAWDTWVIVAEEARKVTPIWNRKRACFKEPEVAELKKAFGAEEVPVSDLLWMLLDSGLPLQHADDRHRFQDALAEAHRTAVDSGSMDDVTDVRKDSIPSPRSSGTVIFATFLHLVRSYLESIKQKQMQREEAALRSVSFSATEVADFRAIFTSHVVSARVQARQELQKEPCHPLSFVVRCLAMQPRVSCSEVIRMAASVGARIKMSHRSMLRKKIREFSDQKTLIDIEDEELPDDEFALEDGVDFAGFLRIMQWMSDCNWCNINTAAEELLLNPRSVATAGFSRCNSAP